MIEPLAVIEAPGALSGAWYKRINGDQWRAFIAAYAGWVLDAFDFTMLTFLLVDIQRSFTVSKALAGWLGSITLILRVAGGIGAGTAADRWGRKGPLLFSILWYSVFAGLCGFSTSYEMLFVLRALFGIGMGGVWAAAMPLTLEHWPADLRGMASGLMQSGYSMGFLLSSLVFQVVHPLVAQRPDGWRVMFWMGVLPAFLIFAVAKGVPESPVWLDRQRHLRERNERDPNSLVRLFHPDVIATTLHTSLLMGAFLFMYHSITFWYPTLIGQMHRPTLPFLAALNIGAITGAVVFGRLSETALGRRGSVAVSTLIGIASIPLYVYSGSMAMLLVGALMMGFFGAGNFGVVPGYLTERFPTMVRAAGAGFAYHVGAGIGALTPALVGALQDRGLALATAMGACIALSGLLVTALMWLGPETRGRQFHAVDR
ncbi:MAG TPA: MFS transporter [Vicinamibacterales bacterium]|jgi:putative sialic acid transporter|nr:MFS transporter [Vicinamibacterales bacterium]